MVIMGYLICEKCEGYYELQEGEDLEDFKSCECGGNLKYIENLKDYYGENLDESLIIEEVTQTSEESKIASINKLINLKSLFLGIVVWVVIDSLLFGVSINNPDLSPYLGDIPIYLADLSAYIGDPSIYIAELSVYMGELAVYLAYISVYIGGLSVLPLLSAQIFSGIVAGFLSGKKFKAGILNGVIIGIFFSIILIILKSNPLIISITVLALLTILGCIGGVFGVLINRKIKGQKTDSQESPELQDEKDQWPKNLAVWLGGLGVIYLFVSYPIFGVILIVLAILFYVSKNFMAIYAAMGGYISYTLIQMIPGVLNLIYANMSNYERYQMYNLVAFAIFNIAISIYVINKTRKLNN